jgi:hypothetical protein
MSPVRLCCQSVITVDDRNGFAVIFDFSRRYSQGMLTFPKKSHTTLVQLLSTLTMHAQATHANETSPACHSCFLSTCHGHPHKSHTRTQPTCANKPHLHVIVVFSQHVMAIYVYEPLLTLPLVLPIRACHFPQAGVLSLYVFSCLCVRVCVCV